MAHVDATTDMEEGLKVPFIDQTDSIRSVGELGGDPNEDEEPELDNRSELAILLDADGNGKISKSELLVFFQHLVSTPLAQRDRLQGKNSKLIDDKVGQALSSAMDSSSDGKTATLGRVFALLLQDTELWIQLTESYGIMDIAIFYHFLLYAKSVGTSLKMSSEGSDDTKTPQAHPPPHPPSHPPSRLRSNSVTSPTGGGNRGSGGGGGSTAAPAASAGGATAAATTDAGGAGEGVVLEKSFSPAHALLAFFSFNTMPLWLLLTWRGWNWPERPGYLTRVRFAIYLHQCRKLRRQLEILGLQISSPALLHTVLVALTWLQFTASWVPLVAFLVKVFTAGRPRQPFLLADGLSCWGSVMPIAVLQFLIFSAALKLSCRDFDNLKEQCKVIFGLGNVRQTLPARNTEGRKVEVTVIDIIDRIKCKARDEYDCNPLTWCNSSMPLIFALALELLRRLARYFLVRNWVGSEPLALYVLPFEVLALVVNIWFAYTDPADCTGYLLWLKHISSYFKVLLNREAAHAARLPCLSKQTPRELLLWSKLRRYCQSPNPLALRAIEAHLTVVLLAAAAVTAIVCSAWSQGKLLSFTPENADLQLFVLWVIPCFIYLVVAFVFDVVWASATGDEYQEGINDLSGEAVAIVEELNRPPCPGLKNEAGAQPPRAPAALSSSPGAIASDGAQAASIRPSAAPAPPPAASGNAHGPPSVEVVAEAVSPKAGEGPAGGREAPGQQAAAARRQLLQESLQVIEVLVRDLQLGPEYISLYGFALDTNLRNAIFTGAVTLIGGAASTLFAMLAGGAGAD